MSCSSYYVSGSSSYSYFVFLFVSYYFVYVKLCTYRGSRKSDMEAPPRQRLVAQEIALASQLLTRLNLKKAAAITYIRLSPSQPPLVSTTSKKRLMPRVAPFLSLTFTHTATRPSQPPLVSSSSTNLTTYQLPSTAAAAAVVASRR